MTVLKGRKAERIVLSRVFVVAHADEAGFEQADYGSEDLLFGQSRGLQVFFDPAANGG